MKTPQLNTEPICKAKVNKETGWVEIYMPDGTKIPKVNKSSLHTGVEDAAYVEMRIFVQIEQD